MLARDTCSAKRHLFLEKLKNLNFTPVLYQPSCQQRYELFDCILNDVIDKTLPFKSVKTYSLDKPWISTEIKRAIAERQKAWRVLGPQSPEFRSLRNKINRLVKKTKQRYFKNKIMQCGKSDNRRWWKEVKRLAGMNNTSQVSSILHNDCLLEGVELANQINNCFIQATANIRELSVQPTILKYRINTELLWMKLDWNYLGLTHVKLQALIIFQTGS